jgi:hypothetical protein
MRKKNQCCQNFWVDPTVSVRLPQSTTPSSTRVPQPHLAPLYLRFLTSAGVFQPPNIGFRLEGPTPAVTHIGLELAFLDMRVRHSTPVSCQMILRTPSRGTCTASRLGHDYLRIIVPKMFSAVF